MTEVVLEVVVCSSAVMVLLTASPPLIAPSPYECTSRDYAALAIQMSRGSKGQPDPEFRISEVLVGVIGG
jgi:hypothetical protein